MATANIKIQPTPNPNALKFITATPVKIEGKSTYKSPLDCSHNQLACALFTISGIQQIHFFKNTITVTKNMITEWVQLKSEIIECISKYIGQHDPDYNDPDPDKIRRSSLSYQLQEIESVLDRTIRSALVADGGDVHCIKYENNILLIQYQGECGNCPSSATSTLRAIQSALRSEYNASIEVFIAPDY